MRQIFTLLFIMIFTSTFSFAENRQAHQQRRISNGLANGKLSVDEAMRLEQNQARISGIKAAAHADGHVSKSERRAIKKALNTESRNIRALKHN